MRVSEAMSKKPDYLAPTSTLKKAAEEMQKYDFGFIPIGENDRLIGVITDRDIAIRAVAQGKNPEKTSVKEAMTKKVLYCFEDDDVEKAAESMCKQQIHRLIVLNKDKRMTGVLTIGDIARKTHNEKLCGHICNEISEH